MAVMVGMVAGLVTLLRSASRAVTFSVAGLSFPSWCNDRVDGPDSCTCRIRVVSAGAVLGHGCSVPVVLQRQVFLVQTMQKSVEFPQVQFLNKLLPARVVQDKRLVQTAQETVEFPQGAVIGQVFACPLWCMPKVVVQTVQNESWQVQFLDKVDAAVVVHRQVPGSAGSFSALERSQL